MHWRISHSDVDIFEVRMKWKSLLCLILFNMLFIHLSGFKLARENLNGDATIGSVLRCGLVGVRLEPLISRRRWLLDVEIVKGMVEEVASRCSNSWWHHGRRRRGGIAIQMQNLMKFLQEIHQSRQLWRWWLQIWWRMSHQRSAKTVDDGVKI